MEIGGFSVPQEVFGLMSCPHLPKSQRPFFLGLGPLSPVPGLHHVGGREVTVPGLPVLGGFLSDPITPHPAVRPGVAGALIPLGRRQAWTRGAGPRTHTDQPQAIFSTRFLSAPEPPSSSSVTQKKRCARFGLAFFLII